MSKAIYSRRIVSLAVSLSLFTALLLPTASYGQSIPVKELGHLKLVYQPLMPQLEFQGNPLTAKVGAYPNSGYPVHEVLEATQKNWLIQSGQLVANKQPIVELSGSAVHHFLTEYDVRKQHLEIVSQRYESNRNLFANQAISSAQWQEISLAYQTALLEFEHLDHFYENIVSISDSHLRITVAAPKAGVLVVTTNPSVLFEIIEHEQLRLIGDIGNQAISPKAVSWSQCELGIARVDSASQGFTRQWSTESLSAGAAECQLNWGTHVTVRPVYSAEVFAVPTAGVVRHEQQQYVWIKEGDNLTFTPITIVGKSAESFYVVGEALSSNDAVLTQSVGAVYGHYLGLGGE